MRNTSLQQREIALGTVFGRIGRSYPPAANSPLSVSATPAVQTPGARLRGRVELHPSRSSRLTSMVEAALRVLGAWVARGLARWKRQRQARAVYLALHQLDARTLRDLGFDRSEIMSVAAELSGATEFTRAHSGPALRGLSD